MERKKIVLDADVLIHFAKAGYLNVLPSILPEYEYIVLSVVYDEVRSIQQQIDRQIEFLKNIRKVQFEPTGEMRREYAMLTSRFGRGESACMAYCRFTDDVIGSSNIKDISVMSSSRLFARKAVSCHWWILWRIDQRSCDKCRRKDIEDSELFHFSSR